MSPVVAWFILANDAKTALWLCSFAGLTDFLDGWLARRFNWKSAFGAFLDPGSDKIMLSLVFLSVGEMGWVPWWVVALVFGRDLLIVLGAALIYRSTGNKQFPPSRWGEISTTLQILCALLVLWHHADPARIGAGLAEISVWLMVAGTVGSGLHYAWLGSRMLKRIEKG